MTNDIGSQERDRLALALAEVLSRFGYRRQVGNVPCLRTGWIWEDDVNRWRRALHDNAGPLATPWDKPEGEPLPGAVPVTPDEMIDLLGAALGLAQRQTAEQTARADQAYRLLDQTRAALHVALYHLRDRPGLADDDAHEQRENELAGCRIALKDATEAVEAAALGTPPAHAQDSADITVRLAAALDTWAQDWHRRREHGATPAQPADAALLSAYDAHQAASGDRCSPAKTL